MCNKHVKQTAALTVISKSLFVNVSHISQILEKIRKKQSLDLRENADNFLNIFGTLNKLHKKAKTQTVYESSSQYSPAFPAFLSPNPVFTEDANLQKNMIKNILYIFEKMLNKSIETAENCSFLKFYSKGRKWCICWGLFSATN